MEITIFAKKRNTKEGKQFFSYLTTLHRKDGSDLVAAVKFRDDCDALPDPKSCPMNIRFDKALANLATREYTREDTGEVAKSYTLWLSGWVPGEEYVDHSMDDIED